MEGGGGGGGQRKAIFVDMTRIQSVRKQWGGKSSYAPPPPPKKKKKKTNKNKSNPTIDVKLINVTQISRNDSTYKSNTLRFLEKKKAADSELMTAITDTTGALLVSLSQKSLHAICRRWAKWLGGGGGGGGGDTMHI